MRKILINGMIGIPDAITEEDFCVAFFNWLEENQSQFGGVINEDEDEGKDN